MPKKMRIRLSEKECQIISEALQLLDAIPWNINGFTGDQIKMKVFRAREGMSKPQDICGSLIDLKRRFSCLADPECDFIARGSRRRSRT